MTPSISQSLAGLPDDCRCALTIGSGDMTVAELREAFAAPSSFRVLTTGQAAEMLGYSSDTWRTWAEEKRIVGAYRDEGEAGNWRLPMKACEEHLARLSDGSLNRSRIRAPWPKKSGAPAQTCGAGSEGGEEGPVLLLRPPAVVGRKADDARPDRAGLA